MLKFIDLSAQYKRLTTNIQERVQKVFEHGQFILGPEVSELEKQLADYVGVRHCIGVANGTDALLIALMALGIGPGDEVIIPDFTFAAPAEMAKLLGAKVVFVDIDAKTYNLDANLLASAITAKTKAIISVSLFGQCADLDAINAYNIPVIEDAAQSFGATYKDKHSGSLSTIACTSFFPSKPLGCYGDGGACFTNDDELAAKMRSISDHGMEGRYNHVRLGLNSRLDTVQAAILLAKLAIFPEEIKRRTKLADKYNKLLKDYVKIPHIEPYNNSVFSQYTVACKNRDQIQKYLQEHNIPTAVHYPKPLHKQIAFTGSDKIFVNAEQAAETVLSLPFSPYLSDQDLHKVVATLIQGLEQKP